MLIDRLLFVLCLIGFIILGIQTYLIARMLTHITELILKTHGG